jgi:hypothetical protein
VQCDRPIPGLEPHLDSGGPVDLSIHLSARPDWAESASTETYGRAEPGDEAPLLRLREYAGDRVLLHYSDDTRFYLDAPRGEVWATWPDTLTLEDTATYLLGPVVGHFLRRRGELCLHGSAVLLGGRCVVFAGPAGAGKSTLAAAMATLGRRILTEDVCCLARDGEAFRVQPGYPRIRLWPDAAALIGVPQAELPPLTPNWDKRFMPLAEGARAFHDRPEPLAAVFVLTPRDDMTEAARLRELGGQEGLAELAANTYGARLLGRGQRATEFALLGELARAVTVRALTLNAEGSRLLEACAWIERHAFA